MGLKPGSVVQAQCSACRAEKRHVVVKAARGVPARVRCRGCGREHAYKPVTKAAVSAPKRPSAIGSKSAKKPVGKLPAPPPSKAGRAKSGGAQAATKPERPKAGGAKPATKGAAPSRPAPPVREPELPPYEKALKDAESRLPEPYRMSGLYHERQRLHHAVFGLGVVTKVLQSNVFEAIFADGQRKLAMAREEPKPVRGAKGLRPGAAVAKSAAARPSAPPKPPARPAATKPTSPKAPVPKTTPPKPAPPKAATAKAVAKPAAAKTAAARPAVAKPAVAKAAARHR